MPSDPASHLTAALLGLGGQRVWSLLVSVFGDLAPQEDAAIDGPALSAIMGCMQVRPEATRVALHRLRNDGWITSRKSGRTSRHSLTPYGRTETRKASHRIYAQPGDLPLDWRILLTETSGTGMREGLEASGWISLTPRVFMGAGDVPPPPDALVLAGTAVPGWLRSQMTSHRLCADYAALHRILVEAERTLPEGTALPFVTQAVVRCLIVHNWRRLVLRHPDLPAKLYTTDWREHDCRALVCTLLARFPRPNLADLSP